ncbi:MAG: ATP-binding cassette domain-containing protein, partial [bacterium]|nr:ATP-binding cassette domain-containing protein [bacterium]
VRRGDCYGFLGHNGAGKTTALRIALGLMRPISGSVIVDGVDALRDPREARARMGGLIEVPGFYLDRSGRHNRSNGGAYRGWGALRRELMRTGSWIWSGSKL